MIFYLVIFIVIFLLIFIYVRYINQKKRAEKLEEFKYNWAKPIERNRNFKLIAQYHQNLDRAVDEILSDEIAEDIDFERLFEYVDRTSSKPGQQYLFQHLRYNCKNLDLLYELDELAERFKKDDELRLTTSIELSELAHQNAYYIHELFTSTYHALYEKWQIVYIKLAGFLWIAMLALTIIQKNQYLFLTTLFLTFVNFYFHYTNKQKIARYVHSIPQVYTLMNVAKKFTGLIKNSDKLTLSLNELAPLKKTLAYVNFQESTSKDPTDVSASVLELIKALLLIEPAMFLISISKINQQKHHIETLFNHVAKIDIAIAILSLRSGLPYYAKPNFNDSDDELHIEEVFHPAIENCVPNSIQVSSRQGILITGSNMSGKTTFIRSIIINALLSQTLFTSCTKSYRAPFMQLFTSIRISDNLEEQTSYFQAEALSVLNILSRSDQHRGNLIIIDEIFRGTNTIERIAAAKAILSYLTAHQNFVFVSTHDLELAELLGDEYSCYSFEEKATDTRLVFDYKIKPGILKNKNGIAILAALGYPTSVVENANQISLLLREKYNL